MGLAHIQLSRAILTNSHLKCRLNLLINVKGYRLRWLQGPVLEPRPHQGQPHDPSIVIGYRDLKLRRREQLKIMVNLLKGIRRQQVFGQLTGECRET